PFRVRRTEVAHDVRFGIGPLLVADDHQRPAFQERWSTNDGRVVPEAAVAVQLDEVIEDPGNQVKRPGTLRMPRQLDASPGGIDRSMVGRGHQLGHRSSSVVAGSGAPGDRAGRSPLPEPPASGSTLMPIVPLTAPPPPS